MRWLRGCLFTLIVVLSGCAAKAPNIVGTWVSTMGGALTTYDFRPDNTFSLDCRVDTYHATVTGKYRFEGNMFSMDPAEVNVEGGGPDLESIRSSLHQSSRLHYQMFGRNSFQLGAQQPPLILTRTAPSR